MADFRFRAWRYTGSVPIIDKLTDMEVTIDPEHNQVSFRITSRPEPRPADNYAGGWFNMDTDVSVLWMNRFAKIDFASWEREYMVKNHVGWAYYFGFYGEDGEILCETSVAGILPPQWDEFIRLMDALYPIHQDREFTWPGGIKYPDEEKKKRQERLKKMYEELAHPDIEEDFCEEFEDLEVFLPDDYGL